MDARTTSGRAHTDREYEQELQKLRDQILLMGAKVEQMLESSMRALIDRDGDLARKTIASDAQIDQLEVESDEMCLRILARRQPVASDLRFLTIALKLVTDLERIGDLAVNICERVLELNQEPPLKPYVDLPRMSEAAQGMVRQALDAFVARDADRARAVVTRDSEVDAYYGQIFRELLTYMMEDPHNIYRATRIQSIAKYLERVGDHATNLAEEVVFMVKGKDIRHSGIKAAGAAARPLPRGILFLCVHNSARSQMAEGWAKRFMPGVKVFSAGSEPTSVNPYATRTMLEGGVDLSGQTAKPIASIPLSEVDLVVSVCAEEICPALPPGVAHVQWPISDPAAATGTEQEIEAAFRRTRDELRRRVESLASG
jgi:phosphate transport system protein